MKQLSLLLLIAITAFVSCLKPGIPAPAEPQLPPITQSGKNTFGCLVDGKVWLPKGGGMLWPIESEYTNGYLFIKANQSTNTGLQTLGLSIWPVYSDTLVNICNVSDNGNYRFFRFADVNTDPSSNNYYYPIGQRYNGELNITKLDRTNRIIAGTFWFDAIDTVSNKRVKIRDGRFDIRY